MKTFILIVCVFTLIACGEYPADFRNDQAVVMKSLTTENVYVCVAAPGNIFGLYYRCYPVAMPEIETWTLKTPEPEEEQTTPENPPGWHNWGDPKPNEYC